MQNPEELIKLTETENFKIGKRKDGIIHVYFKNNVLIDINKINYLFGLYDEYTNGVKACFIFEAGHKVGVTREARHYIKKVENELPVIAGCIIFQNMVYRMIAVFFLRFNQPIKPLYIVNDFDSGIKWLKLQENEFNDLNNQVLLA
ncbi:MAG TPA: hypothetical protein VGF79_06960 [Bacteroidia bacterium]